MGYCVLEVVVMGNVGLMGFFFLVVAAGWWLFEGVSVVAGFGSGSGFGSSGCRFVSLSRLGLPLYDFGGR